MEVPYVHNNGLNYQTRSIAWHRHYSACRKKEYDIKNPRFLQSLHNNSLQDTLCSCTDLLE